MPEETAVIDTPAEIPPAGSTEPTEPPTDGTEPESGEHESQQPGEGGEQPAANGKDVHQAVRTSLGELKKTNPAAANALKQAYFSNQEFQKEFPGGIAEARQIATTLKEFGGTDGVRVLKDSADYLEQIDKSFTAGDPAFIDQLAQASPESFVKIMPAAIDKLEQMAPEAFASLFAQRMLGDMNASGLIGELQWLQRVAGDNAEIKAVADKFVKYLQRLSGFAEKPYAAPKSQQSQNGNGQQDEERTRFEQEKREFTITQWRTVAADNVGKVFSSEFSRLTGGRTVTTEQKAAIIELVQNAINRAETDDDRKKIDDYFASGDQQGYLKFKDSFFKRVVPNAVERATSTILGKKPGPGTQNPTAARPTPSARPTTPAVPGVKMVTEKPAPHLINRRLTSQDDILKGLYTLTDGSKVQVRR